VAAWCYLWPSNKHCCVKNEIQLSVVACRDDIFNILFFTMWVLLLKWHSPHWREISNLARVKNCDDLINLAFYTVLLLYIKVGT
jgi:hypothetical protein